MDYLLNNFRFKRLGNGYLVTTDHGSWDFLDVETFNQLQNDNISDKQVISRLYSKGFLINKENKEQIKKDYRDRYNFLRQGTSLHIVVVTLRCSQKCIYCHMSSAEEDQKEFDMDEETAEKTVEFIFQSPSNYITIEFQGGEPLLNMDAIKLITSKAYELNKKYEKNIDLTLVTNLVNMDDEILDYLINNNITICTSLDGPKELHDKNRPSGVSSYHQVKKWVKKIQEEYKSRNIKNSKVNALVTVTKNSLKYWKEIIDEYLDSGIYEIHLRFLNKMGYAEDNKDKIEYTEEEFIEFWKKSIDYIIEINKSGITFKERGLQIILKKILTKFDPNFLDMRSPCGAVVGQMAYNYNGEIYCCDEARMLKSKEIFKIGNVQNNLRDVVLSDECCSIVAASINETTFCSLCPYKPYCGLCPVCNYSEQKTLNANIPSTRQCKIFRAQFDYVFEKYVNDSKAKDIFDSWIQ